jgi:hypothetical protein
MYGTTMIPTLEVMRAHFVLGTTTLVFKVGQSILDVVAWLMYD